MSFMGKLIMNGNTAAMFRSMERSTMGNGKNSQISLANLITNRNKLPGCMVVDRGLNPILDGEALWN